VTADDLAAPTPAAPPQTGWRRPIGALAVALSCLALAAGFARWVDPFALWSDAPLVEASVDPEDRERFVVPMRLRREHAHTVLVGSSRVIQGMRIEEGLRDGILNGGLRAARIAECVAVIEAALRNPSVERIVWGLDFQAFSKQTLRGEALRVTALRNALSAGEASFLRDALLSNEALTQSFAALRRRARLRAGGTDWRARRAPWSASTIAAGLAEREQRARARSGERRVGMRFQRLFEFEYDPDVFQTYRRGLALARAAGVAVDVIALPLSGYDVEALRLIGARDDLDRWRHELAASGPFLDYSASTLASDPDLFSDVRHFAPPLGHVMLRRALGVGCDGCGERGLALYDAGRRVRSPEGLAPLPPPLPASLPHVAQTRRIYSSWLATHPDAKR